MADTSSIVWPKRHIQKPQHLEIYKRLTKLVEDGELVFVKQVVAELARYGGKPDAAHAWASKNEAAACNRSVPFDVVREVLAAAPVLDPEKPADQEEADPYVLGLALMLRRERVDARVLTEEEKDLPDKLSMASGCGALGIPRMRMKPFLGMKGIWTPAAGLLT